MKQYLAAIGAIILLLCAIPSHAQIFQYPNPGVFGTGQPRQVDDSVLYIPTGCGAPSGKAGLRSYGFNGFGQTLLQAAVFFDTCGHNFYVYDPTDSTWVEGSGSGGTYTADGTTLTLVGNQFSIISTYAGQPSITTLGTVTSGLWQSTPIADAYIASSGNWNAKLGSTLNSANFFVGNGSNVAAGVSMSGDGSLNNAGAFTLAPIVTAGSCTNCNLTYDGKGRITVGGNGSGGSGGNPFPDNAALVENAADHTRLLILSAANIPTGTTNTWTFPGVNGTVARNDAAQTFAGIQTFSLNPIVPNPAAHDSSFKAAPTIYVDQAAGRLQTAIGDSAAAIRGTTFNLHINRLGQPGDTALSYLSPNDSTLFTASQRDSSGMGVHHIVNADLSWTWYSSLFSSTAQGAVPPFGSDGSTYFLSTTGWAIPAGGGSADTNNLNIRIDTIAADLNYVKSATRNMYNDRTDPNSDSVSWAPDTTHYYAKGLVDTGDATVQFTKMNDQHTRRSFMHVVTTALGTGLTAGQHVTTDPVTNLLSTQAEILHQPVLLATAAALPSNIYSNGTAGVGATLTASANAALTVDGVAVATGNRILVKNEASQANNGIYTVTAPGSGSAPYVLTRGSYSAIASNLIAGSHVFAQSGTANANTVWYQQTTGTISIGTTNLVYAETAGSSSGGNFVGQDSVQTYTSGTTLTQTAGYNIIQINPATYQSTLTLTTATVFHTSNDLYITFGGTITSGNPVVTLTMAAGSGLTLVQAINPSGVTYNAGEVIHYKKVGSYLYRWN